MKPGALVATTLKVPRSLLTTNNGSNFIFNIICNQQYGLFVCTTCSRTGRISCTLLIFWSVRSAHMHFPAQPAFFMIAYHIWRYIALTILHTSSLISSSVSTIGFINGNYTVASNLLHRLGNDLANFLASLEIRCYACNIITRFHLAGFFQNMLCCFLACVFTPSHHQDKMAPFST